MKNIQNWQKFNEGNEELQQTLSHYIKNVDGNIYYPQNVDLKIVLKHKSRVSDDDMSGRISYFIEKGDKLICLDNGYSFSKYKKESKTLLYAFNNKFNTDFKDIEIIG